MPSKPHSPLTRLFGGLLLALCVAANSHAYKWDEISQEDLAANECSLDPTAAAEVLYKQLIYDLTTENVRIIKTHIRTKIYEKSALDYARRTKFWYSDHYRASGIHARVIKPDGSYIEVDDKDVVTQTESRNQNYTLRSTTISIPQVEVGDIVEYLYRTSLDEGYYLPQDEIMFQEQWPIRKLELKMKPYVYRGAGFKWASHHCENRMEKGGGGFYEIELQNLPGYPEEPYQAPDSDAKAWFTFYNVTSLTDGDAFWKSESKRLYREMLSNTKSDKTVSAKAAELSKGKSTQQEKLRAFYEYCTHELINSSYGKADRLTADQLKDIYNDWKAGKTIDKGYGTPKNINTVFCALARAVGIDARIAACANRSDYAFTGAVEQIDIALPHTVVGVKKDKEWTFYNPACKYIPFGQLDWIHDQVTALVPDKKQLILIKTQAASPEQNISRSEGEFELSPDGTLSGRFKLTAQGNPAFMLKQTLDEQSESEREKSAKEALSKPWPNGEMDNWLITNADDPSEPVVIECDLTIPNYAESVGDRLFVRPNVEERYSEAEFPALERKTPIFFDFKYRTESEIRIKLPEGYALEAPSAPRPTVIEGLFDYSPKLAMTKKSNTLIYRRTLDFVGNRYPAEAYPIIKRAFDTLLEQDQHTLTLKKEEASASANETTSQENE